MITVIATVAALSMYFFMLTPVLLSIHDIPSVRNYMYTIFVSVTRIRDLHSFTTLYTSGSVIYLCRTCITRPALEKRHQICQGDGAITVRDHWRPHTSLPLVQERCSHRRNQHTEVQHQDNSLGLQVSLNSSPN